MRTLDDDADAPTDERQKIRRAQTFTDDELDGIIDRIEERWAERLGKSAFGILGDALKRVITLVGAGAILALLFAGDKVAAILKWFRG